MIKTTGKKPTKDSPTTYTVTDPEGKEWILRPLPAHFYLFSGQLPATMSEKAIKALNSGDEDALEDEMRSQMSVEQIFDSAMFARDAVTYACVKPKITISPKNKDEISPFKISEEVFLFLTRTVIKPQGVDAAKAANFRGKS